MEVKFASHCSYQIKYRQVMCIKCRKRLLKNEHDCDELKKIFKEVGERYWFEIDEMGTDGDHVHVFVGAAGRWAPSQIMQVLKSVSAKELYNRLPVIRKNMLWGGEFWSDGGYIGTAGGGKTQEDKGKKNQNTT